MSIAQPCIKTLDIWVKFIAFTIQINIAHIPCQAIKEPVLIRRYFQVQPSPGVTFFKFGILCSRKILQYLNGGNNAIYE